MPSFYVAVGPYSVRGGRGISVLNVSSDTGAMTCISTVASGNANFLAMSPGGRYLYAADEIEEAGDARSAAVTSFRWDNSSGILSPISRRIIAGASPCHVAIDPTGRWLATSNYADGAHALLPLPGDGSIGPAIGLTTNDGVPGPNQESGHAHATVFDGPSLLYACDLGLDRVISYKLTEEGRLHEIDGGSAPMPPGAGPRHITLHPRLPIAYVINELDSTICVLSRSAGHLSILQTISTLPADYAGHSFCADIHLGEDERFLYGSNRGHDSLAVFAVDGTSGLLNAAGYASTGGNWPRSFCLLPGGLVLVANERSDSITAFRAGPDGIPIPTGERFSIPSPMCVMQLD